MTILPPDTDPELIERIVATQGGDLARKMNIDFIELSAAAPAAFCRFCRSEAMVARAASARFSASSICARTSDACDQK